MCDVVLEPDQTEGEGSGNIRMSSFVSYNLDRTSVPVSDSKKAG